MQEERNENVEDTEEVEAHKRFGPSEELPARSDQEDEDEVEAHKRFGPSEEEPAARSDQGAEDEDVEAHRWPRTGPEEFGKRF